MSFNQGQPAWPAMPVAVPNGNKMLHSLDDGLARTQTPVDTSMTLVPEASDIEEDHRRAHFADLFRKSESKIALLFSEDGSYNYDAIESWNRAPAAITPLIPATTDDAPIQEPPLKKAKRMINEDDYDDDDDEDDEDEDPADTQGSPLKSKGAGENRQLLSPSKSGSSPIQSVSSPEKHTSKTKDDASSQGQVKTSEDARKELEEARIATEEAAKRSFHTLIYTLENDRTAMLEQQQLEESEKQLQAEMEKNTGPNSSQGPGQNQGTLSSANLGASSLTLKHLIARIDQKRNQVRASDAELRSLMNEVRKNRSKWASEENVGQEELYEAAEKVLSELKAHTEYSTPFLQRVNKRDAPDYYNLIKQPMDLGTMTKKLKGLQYKSKADFVYDLNLIWDNCLKYNQDLNHHLRRMANGMRKEAEKLIPLIPDIVVRPRAEVEAEERRKQNGGEDDGGDDSDDEPIMSSRGRKAGTKGTNKSRKAPSDQKENTPTGDQKPVLQLNGLLAKGREGSEAVDGSNGFGTPPVAGSITPIGTNGHSGTANNADAMDIDGPSLNGLAFGEALGEAAAQVYEDEEYKIWKQVTKRDRALVAKQRHQLFQGCRLNPDEPALLRTKSGMRRFLKNQQQAESSGLLTPTQAESSAFAVKQTKAPETLAEGMEDEEERVLPDYYEPQTIIPDIPTKLQWVEDGEGQVINQHEDFLKIVPPGHFTAPSSRLTKRIDANIHQMQETRKLCSKIGVIKQMQIQTQIYQNQFPKYNPEPFVEADIEPHFTAGEGVVMAPEACRSALQRSVGKILYHAGFEEFQPSALETITDIAADFFQKLVRTFNVYNEADKKPATGTFAEQGHRWQPRFTPEEVVLHTLAGNGYDPESLETYAKEDVERLGGKLVTIHERMKAHLSDLLRPALNDAGPDGAGAFKDGSEQFVGGDFAEELGEDFFGFKSLGLDKELGLDFLSVPLHLLQRRVYANHQSQAAVPGAVELELCEPLPPLDPVTKENIQEQIGLVKNFFLAKLHANQDQPLVEDEDLPVKQRRPRPRLGATGKIVSPQKRPPKEQIALAKKKKKLVSGLAQVTDGKGAVAGALAAAAGGANAEKGSTPVKKLKGLSNPALVLQAPGMERVESMQSLGNTSQTDRDEGIGMMSPESIH
ncbi:bromodomain-containing protein [Magnaporthiopsis poae ATCC 64411]|uniref:SAGA complex subunit Spt7 n=1 Tax=Magnaporthiopsis poae (strain ATCC 64411 / 73-15) TaxID=644358 RepID=A0A0C4DVQ8_MAGP6|nr:bromodomain-containing protein [Magnaporthiopsis poae ATCC 64411]